MFVQGFDESWLKHPFWRSKFLIKDPDTLREVQASGIPHCWIDASKGQDIEPEKPREVIVAVTERPARKPRVGESQAAAGTAVEKSTPTKRVTLSEELQEAAFLRQRSAQTMKRLFAEVRLGNAIEPAECVARVDEVVESIDRHPDALLSLARLKNADEYTYMHSVAVCALMVSLGRQLGLSDDQCREAGMAGMLHDLGKAAMPQDVLNKPGKLTPEEFEIIKTHPRRGYEMLIEGAKVSDGVKDVCLHHHERYDG